MKKRISRALSGILIAGMIVTSLPADVMADTDLSEPIIEENVTEETVIEETAIDEVAIEEKNIDDDDVVTEDDGFIEEELSIPGEDISVLRDCDNADRVSEAASLTASYYVVSSNRMVECNNNTNYIEDSADGEALYESPLTDSVDGDHELFSAFYNDVQYERQGGKYYTGFDVIKYDNSSTKVYDPSNFAKYLSDNSLDPAVPLSGVDKPSSVGSDDMVFVLDKLPAELFDQFRLFVWDRDGGNYEYKTLAGVKLYAWEYERQNDGRYKKKASREIPKENYVLDTDPHKVYTNKRWGVDNTYVETASFSGAVKVNSTLIGNGLNPVAIVAMVYDAAEAAGSPESVKELTADGACDIWENDLIFKQLSGDYNGHKYFVDNDNTKRLNNYWDDMYSAAAMGEFSLNAYTYYKDGSNVYLYGCDDYATYVNACTNGYLSLKDGDLDTRDWEAAEAPISKWEIPESYTDPYDGKTYHVCLGNVAVSADSSPTGVSVRNLYPGLAMSVVIDYGVTFPSDSSGLLKVSMPIMNTTSFEIKGDAASVGGGSDNTGTITNLSWFVPATNVLTKLDIAALDTSHVISMSHMFDGIFINGTSVNDNIDVSHFDTSNVKNFDSMFAGYQVKDKHTLIGGIYTKLDLSGWDTSNAEDMAHMFDGMRMSGYEEEDLGILDLSSFEFTGKLKDMQGMFAGHGAESGGNGVKGGLFKIIFPKDMDTSNVVDMSYLFAGDEDLEEIVNFSGLDTDSVEDMSDMFGAALTSRNVETWVMSKPAMGEGSWIYHIKTDIDPGLNVANAAALYAKGSSRGVLLDRLDLSNFNTKKVKYAYGMFYNTPNLEEIIWGPDTTFESLTDATHMFICPALTGLDLTGRKMTNLKYAHNMIDLDSADEIILGENSLGLANISEYGRFSISAPVQSIDFRNVAFSERSFDKNSLRNNDRTMYNFADGLTSLSEIILPAEMPNQTDPAVLPTTFFDEDGNSYDRVMGGNTGVLRLSASAAGYELTEIKAGVNTAGEDGYSTGEMDNPDSVVLDMKKKFSGDEGYHACIKLYVYDESHNRGILTPAPEIRWEIEQEDEILGYRISEEDSNYYPDDTLHLTAKKPGTATVRATVDEKLSWSCKFTVYNGNAETTIYSADGNRYKGVKLEDNTYMLTGCTALGTGVESLDLTKSMGTYEGGNNVIISRIGEYAFSRYKNDVQNPAYNKVTGIKIPASVKYIDNYAFYQIGGQDKAVTSVNIAAGSQLVSIGNSAFSQIDGYDALKDTGEFTINLENAASLKSIGWSAFSDNNYLKTINVPDSVTEIGGEAFADCDRLGSVRLSAGIAVIPDRLFYKSGYYTVRDSENESHNHHTDLTISNLNDVMSNITSIGERAFYSDSVNEADGYTLKGANIYAPKLISIGDDAFHASGITGISAPACTSLASYTDNSQMGSAFAYCKSLKSASFPAVKKVPEFTFCYCTALTSLDISSVTEIENSAFSNAAALSSAILPEGLITIGDSVFNNTALSSITLPEGLRTIGSGAFSKTKLKELVIPDSVLTIGDSLCTGCKELESVTIGSGITEIPEKAFAGNMSVTGEWDTDSLKYVYYGDNVTSIGDGAFGGAMLESIDIPSQITNIGEDAFKESYVGIVDDNGDMVPGGINAIALPYAMTAVPDLKPRSYGFNQSGSYTFPNKTYIKELYLPYSIQDVSLLGEDDLFRKSQTDKLIYSGSYQFRHEGRIYYPGTRRELEALFEAANKLRTYGDKYNTLDLYDIEYGTGWKKENGKLVFYKKGVQQKAETGEKLVQKVGDKYYLLNDDGSYVTDTIYVDTVSGNNIYYFGTTGAGEKNEITASDITGGSMVYNFCNGTVHAAMKAEGGSVEAVKGSSDTPSASGIKQLKTTVSGNITTEKFYAYPSGILAKGYAKGDNNDGFYFDDYDKKDGRLVWYEDNSTSPATYYSDVSKSDDKLLGGTEGVILPDRKGDLVTYKNGRMISLANSDLTLSATPAFDAGTAKLTLYTGGDAGSAEHPSAGTLKVTIDTATKNLDLTGAAVAWSIIQSFPRVGGTRVAILGDGTALSGNSSSADLSALAAGSVKIRATLTDKDGNTAYQDASVSVMELDPVPKKVTVTSSVTGTIPKDGKVTLTASLEPLPPAGKTYKQGYDKVSWTITGGSGIASIKDNGDGTATLTNKYTYSEGYPETQKVTVVATTKNGVSGRITLTLSNRDNTDPNPPGPGPSPVSDNEDAAEIVLNKGSISLYQGESFKLSATVNPAGTKDKTVTWTTSNPAVAIVNDGKVTAVAAGVDGSGNPAAATAKITATANGAKAGEIVKAECTVTVLPKEIVDTDEHGNIIDPSAPNSGVTTYDEDNGEANIWVAGLEETYYYTGYAIKPEIHVYKGYKLLTAGTDYTIKYKNNTKVGKHSVTAKGKHTGPHMIIKMKGAYSGSETVGFNINPMPLTGLMVSDGSRVSDNVILNAAYKAKKKNQLKPALMYDGAKVKYGKKDVTFRWYTTDDEGMATETESTCIEPGTYAVKIFAGTSGNLSDPGNNGRQVATIRVEGKPLMSSVKINGFKSKLAYKDGGSVEQPATVKLTHKDKSGTRTLSECNAANPDGDYTVTYTNNHEPGTATVIYEAVKDETTGEYTGSYTGRVVKTYKITGKSVLREAVDHNSLNVGECKIVLGTETDGDKYAFTNSQIKPPVTVTAKILNNEGEEEEIILRPGKDYSLKYKNNKAVAANNATKKNKDAAPQVIIKGKGNYVFGTTGNAGIVKRFTIIPADLNDLILTISDRTYSKKANDYKKTKILLTDKDYRDLKLKAGAGKDYTVTYETSDGSSAPAAGQVVTVTIKGNNNDSGTGTGSCKGEVKGSYRIIDKKKHKDINKAKAVVNPNNRGKAQACIYTGSGIEPGQAGQPELKITFGSGKNLINLTEKTAANPAGDYEILGYFNNVNKGNSAVVLIRGTGDTFRGVRAVKFKIAARGVGSRWGGIYGQE